MNFSCLAILGAAASGRKLRLRESTFARCVERLREFFLASLCHRGGCKRSETVRLREYTFARCAIGRLRRRLREFFLGSLCYRGGCKRLATVSCPNVCMSFFLPRCAGGSCKRSETEIARRIYVRSLCRWAVARTHCVHEFFLASLYRGGCKWSETEIARIYVRSLCH